MLRIWSCIAQLWLGCGPCNPFSSLPAGTACWFGCYKWLFNLDSFLGAHFSRECISQAVCFTSPPWMQQGAHFMPCVLLIGSFSNTVWKAFCCVWFFTPLPFVLKQVVVLAVLLESTKCPCPTHVSRFGECQTRISPRTLNPKQHLPSADKAWIAHNQSTGSHCREKNKRLPYKQPHIHRQSIIVLPHTMAQLRKKCGMPRKCTAKDKKPTGS